MVQERLNETTSGKHLLLWGGENTFSLTKYSYYSISLPHTHTLCTNRKIFKTSATMGTVTWEQLERIANMHDKLAAGVDMDFNYLTLLLVASVVAGLGLALDSSTTVISSMLLSPIMGPVLGMSYGLVIWDWTLIKRSMRNETVSIVICVLFGVLIGKLLIWLL